MLLNFDINELNLEIKVVIQPFHTSNSVTNIFFRAIAISTTFEFGISYG